MRQSRSTDRAGAALHHTSDQTAHELRTPLMRLDLRLQQLIELSPEPERQKPLLIAILLDNALKYVPAGGTVRLSLERGPRLSVIDDGPGVPAVMRERIFERFQRADPDRRGGHGLGLAPARAIAHRHGLAIRCEDRNPSIRQRAASDLADLGATPADASVVDMVKQWSRADHRAAPGRHHRTTVSGGPTCEPVDLANPRRPTRSCGALKQSFGVGGPAYLADSRRQDVWFGPNCPRA